MQSRCTALGRHGKLNRHDRNQTETPLVQVQPADAVCAGDGTVRLVGLSSELDLATARLVRKLRVDSGKTEAASARTETLQGHDSPTIPWIRRVFGDQAYSILILPEKYTPELIERANDLFPEALVHRWGGRKPFGSGGEWHFTIDVTNHSKKRLRDDYKPLPVAANISSFPSKSIPIKDNRKILIRDESVERAMQVDRLLVPRIRGTEPQTERQRPVEN